MAKLINRIPGSRLLISSLPGFIRFTRLWERMLNRSASLAMSTSVLKALPGKLDIKRHSPCILYFCLLWYHADSLHAWFIAVVSSLIVRRWVRPQTQRRPLREAFIRGLVTDACLWLGPPWINLRFSLALTIRESWAIFFVSS